MADDSTESGQSITEQSMSILLLPASTTDRLVAQLAGWHLLDRAGDGRYRADSDAWTSSTDRWQ